MSDSIKENYWKLAAASRELLAAVGDAQCPGDYQAIIGDFNGKVKDLLENGKEAELKSMLSFLAGLLLGVSHRLDGFADDLARTRGAHPEWRADELDARMKSIMDFFRNIALPIATMLFKHGEISGGRGAEMCGYTRAEFIEAMSKAGHPVAAFGGDSTLDENGRPMKLDDVEIGTFRA